MSRGAQPCPTAWGGVYLYGCPSNTVGGSVPGAGNLISGNSKVGVAIGDPGAIGNRVQGNLLGTQADGWSPLGNEWHGIEVLNLAASNVIGGSVAGAANRIALARVTGYDGVRVRTARAKWTACWRNSFRRPTWRCCW